MTAVTIEATEIHTNQEWASTPDMISIELSEPFLEKLEKCQEFMKGNDVDIMSFWFSMGYELYALANDDEKETIAGKNGQSYCTFDPEYRIDGATAKLFKDGDIRAQFQFKHHCAHELWCEVGNLAKLKEQAKQATASGKEEVIA